MAISQIKFLKQAPSTVNATHQSTNKKTVACKLQESTVRAIYKVQGSQWHKKSGKGISVREIQCYSEKCFEYSGKSGICFCEVLEK